MERDKDVRDCSGKPTPQHHPRIPPAANVDNGREERDQYPSEPKKDRRTVAEGPLNLPKRFSEAIGIYVGAAQRLVAEPSSLLALTAFDLALRDAKAAVTDAYGKGKADMLNRIVREAYHDIDRKAPAKCAKAHVILRKARGEAA